MTDERQDPSPLQKLAWVVATDYVDRGRKPREDPNREDYQDIHTNTARYKLSLTKTGKKKYNLTIEDTIFEETDVIQIPLALLEGNEEYHALIQEANKKYNSKIEQEKQERLQIKQERKEHNRRVLRNIGKESEKPLKFVAGGLIGGIISFLPIRACNNYTNSPEYLRKIELDAKAAQILPQPNEIVTYTLDDETQVQTSIRSHKNIHNLLTSYGDGSCGLFAIDFGNITLLSESFLTRETSNGDARNLDIILIKNQPSSNFQNITYKKLTRDQIPNQSEWQTVYENLILDLAGREGKKESLAPQQINSPIEDQELKNLETLLNQLKE